MVEPFRLRLRSSIRLSFLSGRLGSGTPVPKRRASTGLHLEGALGRGSGSGSFEASAAAASSFLTRPGLSSLDDGLEHKTRTPDDSMVVRNVGGNWLFWNMTAGPSSPFSYDHNYYS